jgi:hypothetical protein
MAVVFSKFPHARRPRDWTNDELAELYRVEHAMGQANLALEVDRGVTDEGDPWFVFCRDGGEVLVHITRYDGLYHLFSPSLPKPLVGKTFSALTRSFVSMVPPSTETTASSNVVRHPSALLSLLVVSIFFSIDYLSGHGGSADAAPVIPAKTMGSGRADVIRLVVANMLTSVGGSDAESVLELANLAGQAAILFIGSDIVVCEQQSSLSVAESGMPMVAVPADRAPLQMDSQAPLASQSEGITSVDALAGSTTPASGVCAVGDHTSDTVAEPARATAPIMPAIGDDGGNAAAVITPHAPVAILGDGPGQNSFSLSDHMIFLASAAGSEVNLAGNSSIDLIELKGDGAITLSGLSGNGLQAIEVFYASAEILNLEFTSSNPKLKQTVTIADGSSVTLQSISVQGESTWSTLNATIDSAGNQSNTLTICDAAIQGVTLNLTIMGYQNLVLNESVKVLANSSLDASGFQGQLTVGIDLNGLTNPTTLVGSSDFVVNDNGIVALMNVPNKAMIQIATDLESVMTQFADTSSAHSLSFDLRSSGAGSNPIAINIVRVDGASTLDLGSEGGGSVTNKIQALIDPDLQNLEIYGSGSLSIGSIFGVTSASSQNVTIDASKLSGGLSIDVGQIGDVAAGDRQITVIGGQGNNVLSNSTPTENTVFVGGGGQDLFKIAGGAQSVTIKGLHSGDTVVVGGGVTNDAVVDAIQLPGASTPYLNSLTLQSAASAVASLASASAAHQAVLFEHDNNVYVFIDANGNHVFDAGTDALIQIVGMANPIDLTHVFFSA